MTKEQRRALLVKLHQARIERENAALGEIVPSKYEVEEEFGELDSVREQINTSEKVLTSDER